MGTWGHGDMGTISVFFLPQSDLLMPSVLKEGVAAAAVPSFISSCRRWPKMCNILDFVTFLQADVALVSSFLCTFATNN